MLEKLGLSLLTFVALRKESVDRNVATVSVLLVNGVSLSARRAWIEIRRDVILRLWACPSLSARRAWIEIFTRSTLAYVS